MVFRLLCVILAAFVVLTACRDDLKTKEKVQQAVVDRLQEHSGLDLKALDVSTTDVKFDQNKAVATVAFHPKGDTSINSGMTMKYNLEERDGKWVVTGVNNAQGTPLGTHPPVGQSPMGQSPAGQPEGQLPPGHPALPSPPTTAQ